MLEKYDIELNRIVEEARKINAKTIVLQQIIRLLHKLIIVCKTHLFCLQHKIVFT